MIRVGVADYGMNVWDGGLFDYEERQRRLKEIGFDGIERLESQTDSAAMQMAARIHKMGMDFATCRGSSPETAIQWTAALGKKYVWVMANGKDFDTFCRQVNHQVEICKNWGVRVGLHNHLGSLVETQEQLLAFLERCPDCGLILDTGHLAVAEGGDPALIAEQYFDRLVAVHVKEWVSTDPSKENWFDRGRFCGLSQGNTPIDNQRVVEILLKKGYDGWVFVEHDTHLRDPFLDLAESRKILRSWGI